MAVLIAKTITLVGVGEDLEADEEAEEVLFYHKTILSKHCFLKHFQEAVAAVSGEEDVEEAGVVEMEVDLIMTMALKVKVAGMMMPGAAAEVGTRGVVEEATAAIVHGVEVSVSTFLCYYINLKVVYNIIN